MVTVFLRGGLGNQLFQYATGRAHALRTASDLYINTTLLNQDYGSNVTNRSLRIDIFDLPIECVELNLKYIWISKKIRRTLQKIPNINRELAMNWFNVYIERYPLTFDSSITNLPANVILDGYWQSEQYFKEFTPILRREISVHEPLRGENKQWYERISDTNSISVHIRRGDYTSLDRSLPAKYYRNALKRIHSDTAASNIFFFSDDMDWVRSNSQKLLPDQNNFDINYIECNDGETAHEDLRLMRSCDHHVIANSTFSWWGAWLNRNKKKKVVAPNYWIHDSVDDLDIVPDRWMIQSW